VGSEEDVARLIHNTQSFTLDLSVMSFQTSEGLIMTVIWLVEVRTSSSVAF